MAKTISCKTCDRPIGNLAKETKGLCPRCLPSGKKGKTRGKDGKFK